ncbi:uncharacterized protein LOC131225345 [Magnolia sinica]|uniref:uncharacterized protein LOC131225345 n=1 Tax=Magnolia sinica TaxID=86752 RepID=UPI002657F141|nr:uncharacterized protein LOC131225345 [Magnolia sinica]
MVRRQALFLGDSELQQLLHIFRKAVKILTPGGNMLELGHELRLPFVNWVITNQVKIWEDRKALPLLTLRPHDDEPINSVTFLTVPHHPDHIVLITMGYYSMAKQPSDFEVLNQGICILFLRDAETNENSDCCIVEKRRNGWINWVF